jgi:hypothetical protein
MERLEADWEITNKVKLLDLSRQAGDRFVCKDFSCKCSLVTNGRLKRENNTYDKIGNVCITTLNRVWIIILKEEKH